jgi:hypothetical protein
VGLCFKSKPFSGTTVMKCYYHPLVDAVAICKHCYKGLCLECALDTGSGMACKGSTDKCPEEVEYAYQLMSRNKRQYLTARRAYTQWAILLGIPGGVFTLYGLSGVGGDIRVIAATLMPLGIILLLIALYFYRTGKNYPLE